MKETIIRESKKFVVIEQKEFEKIQLLAAQKSSPVKKLTLAACKKIAYKLIETEIKEEKRRKNESEYELWIEKDGGGRIYSFEVLGKSGWKAKYVKEVDENEVTLKVYQEVYDELGILKEIHENYPIDKGYKKL